MKDTFIQALANKQISFADNEAQFNQLQQENKEVFKPLKFVTLKEQHYWSSEYFDTKIEDLKFNFSKELIEHIIEVKKYLQQQKLNGFIVEDNLHHNVTENKSQNNEAQKLEQAVDSQAKFAEPDLSHFKPKERLANFIKEKDIERVRSELMSYLNNRRMTIEEVVKSIWYVYKHLPTVFVEPEESAFVQKIDNDSANWNSDSFNLQQVYLNYNFTLERLLHLVNMRETLLKRGDKDFQQIKVEQNSNLSNDHNHQPKASTSQNFDNSDNHFIKKVMIIGGAVLAAIIVLFNILK